jgi:hypothetical protein
LGCAFDFAITAVPNRLPTPLEVKEVIPHGPASNPIF